MEYGKYNEEFYGIYAPTLTNFVVYKRSQGFKYGKSRIYKLKLLNRYIIDNFNPSEITLSEEMVFGFLNNYKNFSSESYHNIECLLRQLGLYLKRVGYDNIYIYPENKKRVTTDFVPYIYSKEEITRLFNATDELPEKNGLDNTLRIFYQTLIRLLYSTGMRISEILSLKEEHVDLENGIITVIDGKEQTSRLIPICTSMNDWLKVYSIATIHDNRSDYFFKPTKRSKKRAQSTIDQFFKNELLKRANIQRKPDNTGPRIHDLRHTFACHCLDKMIKEQMDPYCALPYLSTYLGHKGIESTEKYLRLTEEHFKEMTDATHHIYKESIGDKDEN